MNELEQLKREERASQHTLYEGRDVTINVLRLKWKGFSLRERVTLVTAVTLFLFGVGYVIAGPTGSTLTQRQYAFYHDDGSDVNSGTIRTGSATSTAISNVRKGERMNVRIQVDNSGAGAATTTYRLQWENNTDNPNVWSDLSTTTQIHPALSDRGAIYSSWGSPPLPSIKVTSSCSSGYTYSPGRFAVAIATTTPVSINPSSCTEFMFAIETSGALPGKTYRLRLVTGSTTQTLDSYSVYPTFSMQASDVGIAQISKEARGITTTKSENYGDPGWSPSILIGNDGNPFVVHEGSEPGFSGYPLRAFRCTDTVCMNTATSTLWRDSTKNIGWLTSVGVVGDGFISVTHQDYDNYNLLYTHCTNFSCSATTSGILDGEGIGSWTAGTDPGLVVGADGNPMMFHFDGGPDFYATRCSDSSCTSWTSTIIDTDDYRGSAASPTLDDVGRPFVPNYQRTFPFVAASDNLRVHRCLDNFCNTNTSADLSTTNDVGAGNSVITGFDGNQLIAFADQTNGDLRLIRCANRSCSSYSDDLLTSFEGSGNSTFINIGIDGNPVIAHQNGWDNTLRFFRCYDSACSSTSDMLLDSRANAGKTPVMAIGVDGNPIVMSQNSNSGTNEVLLIKCNAIDCASSGETANMNSSTTLRKLLDNKGYERVQTSDDLRDSLEGSANVRMAYLSRLTHLNTTDPLTLTWEGQLSVATATYLQVYNQASSRWDGVATNTSPTANTDFTLATTITNVSNYFDGTGVIAVRVITGTTTVGTVMRTDLFTVETPDNVTQRQYGFYTDDGSDLNTHTLRAGSSTSSPISSVKIGERMNLRIQVDNAGQATSTGVWVLQYENNTDSPNTWVDVGTTTEIRVSLSERTAMRARWGSPPLPSRKLTTTCNASATYISGRSVVAEATSSAVSIGGSQCTEFQYAIETSGALVGKTYRFRLIRAYPTRSVLDTYSAYPTLTTVSSMNDVLKISKEARGATSTFSIEGRYTVGSMTALTIGIDGNPFAAFYDYTNFTIRSLVCSDAVCTATSGAAIDQASTDKENVPAWPQIALGSSGYPTIGHFRNSSMRLIRCLNGGCTSTSSLIMYVGGSADASLVLGGDGITRTPLLAGSDDLYYAECLDSSCVATTSRILETTNIVGYGNTMMLGINGNPFIAHLDISTSDLRLTKCSNANCTVTNSLYLETANNIGEDPSGILGLDGNPMYVHQDATNLDLRYLRCSDIGCTGTSGVLLEGNGSVGVESEIALGVDGYPVVVHQDLVNRDLRFIRCNNTSCTSTSGGMLYGTNDVGWEPEISIGVDGYPIMIHESYTDKNLYFTKCNSLDCGFIRSNMILPTSSTTDLRFYLDNDEYTKVGTSDDSRDSIVGGANTTIAYQGRMTHGNNSDSFTVSWEGQLSVATSTFLQLYNRTAGKWETVATNTSPTPNTDFTLSALISTGVSTYIDPAGNLSLRAVTGTTTQATTMRTDLFSVTIASPSIDLLRYRWRNDDGIETTASAAAGESTSLTTGTYKGDRKRLRIQLNNAGGSAASSYRYRLEVSSSTCTVWVPVPTDSTLSLQHWVMDYSQYVPDGAVTTNVASLLTDPVGTFSAGLVTVASSTSASLTILRDYYSEIEYSVRSTQYVSPGTTYCFRVTNDGSTTYFTYTVQPQIVVSGEQRPVAGGASTESDGGGTPHGGGTAGSGTGGESGGSGSSHGGGSSKGGGAIE
jgi:hypothetical protein